jgi:exonuclease SbcD
MAGIAGYYAGIRDAAVAKRNELGMELPIVATGHLTTVGASRSESVREIYVGSLNAFPTDRFPPADYIALGHIHKPMVVGGHEHIRYSGSPIPLAFDEVGQGKQVLLVEFEAGHRKGITSIPVPTFQSLLRIRGAIDTLPELLAAAAAGHTPAQPAWVEITVEAGDYLPDLVARVNEMVEGLPLDVLKVRRATPDAASSVIPQQPKTLDELCVEDVFEQVIQARSNILEERLPKVRALFAVVAAEVQEEATS